MSRGVFPLDRKDFQMFGIDDPDPRWLHHGVFEFAPSDVRKSWVYVTSGYSNPWHVEPEDYLPDGDSGAGIEYLMETDRQGDWAIVHLRRMLVLQLLLESERIVGNGPLAPGDRIPLKEPIDWIEGHEVQNLMPILGDWPEMRLPSGTAIFVQFYGLTNPEVEFAKSHGSKALLERLRDGGAVPVIVPDRASVV